MLDEPVPGFRLDLPLVDAFVDGRLDEAGEAGLADQVALVMPFHAQLPIPIAAALERVERRLGGDAELFAWLDRHPGRPRMTARCYAVIALLDEVGAMPPVVTALRELREREPDPEPLRPFLVPATTDETLPSVSYGIEETLGDGRPADAVTAAVAAAQWLRRLTPRAAELDPKLQELGDRAALVAQEARAAIGDG
ncbi:hypothetical protein [Pseudonocardia acidicola]|uniref:Uncharacterized protein n=1 Tax=Pseudonocardia acidicola TaxID=2724939 RepID=A0ABX1S585_9PSEU|nr:hypothetical protein [Pseudonocardia acidicola]NMH96074.1 hypothetical protein [Pseudonocardia acidicola]